MNNEMMVDMPKNDIDIKVQSNIDEKPLGQKKMLHALNNSVLIHFISEPNSEAKLDWSKEFGG